jgi:hypothetical protein
MNLKKKQIKFQIFLIKNRQKYLQINKLLLMEKKVEKQII